MSDSYIITFKDGRQAFFNQNACFAPMNRLAQHLNYSASWSEDDAYDAVPVSITYMIYDKSITTLRQYVQYLAKIPQFHNLILGAITQEHAAMITLCLDKPTDAVLYCLSAFRYLKERSEDKEIIKMILDANVKNHALGYLLMENMRVRDSRLEPLGHSRGHSNGQPNLFEKDLRKFITLTRDSAFGKQENFSTKKKFSDGWGSLAGREDKNVGWGGACTQVFKKIADGVNKMAKDMPLHRAIGKYCDEFCDNAPKAKVKKTIKALMGKANNARMVYNTYAVKYTVPHIRAEDSDLWTRLMDCKLAREDRQRLYMYGYRQGYRVNNKKRVKQWL